MSSNTRLRIAAFRFGPDYLAADVRATGTLDCGAGTFVQVGPDGEVGAQEIEAALKATVGVDAALMHPRWVTNHYR